MLFQVNSDHTPNGFLSFDEVKKVVDYYGGDNPTVLLSDANSLAAAPDFERYCKSNNLSPLFGAKLMVEKAGGKRGYITVIARNNEGLREIASVLSEIKDTIFVPSSHTFKLSDLKGRLANTDVLLDEHSPSFTSLLENDERSAAQYRRQTIETGASRVLYKNYLVDSKVIQASPSLSRYQALVNKVKPEVKINTSEISALRPEQIKAATYRQAKHADQAESEMFFSERHLAINARPNPTSRVEAFDDIRNVTFSKESYVPDIGGSYDFVGTAKRNLESLLEGKSDQENLTYRQRLEEELSIVSNLNYTNYFKLICAFSDYCKKKGVKLNLRGSAASSLLLYLNNVTSPELNPVALGLDLRRFIGEHRKFDKADVDIEIPHEYTQLFTTFVEQFGDSIEVSSICVYERFKKLSSTIDYAAQQSLDQKQRKAFDRKVFNVLKKTEAINKWKAYKDSEINDIDHQKLLSSNEFNDEERGILSTALALKGKVSTISVHASKRVISYKGDTAFPKLDKDGTSIAMLTGHNCEDCGYEPFDIISSRLLTGMMKCEQALELYRIGSIDITDAFSKEGEEKYRSLYLQLSQTNNMINQISSDYAMGYINDIAPENITEFAYALAKIRPAGTEDSQENAQHTTLLSDPTIENILSRTRGDFCYDEQILQICEAVASLSNEQGDQLRSAIRKVKPKVIEELREPFIQGAISNGRSKEKAEQLYSDISDYMGKYFFNESHAMSYAALALKQMIIKEDYPHLFLQHFIIEHDFNNSPRQRFELEGGVELTDAQNNKALGIKEFCNRGFNFLPADINKSQSHLFWHDGNVKNVYPSLKSAINNSEMLGYVLKVKAQCGGKISTTEELCLALNMVIPNNKDKSNKITSTLKQLAILGALDSIPFNDELSHLQEINEPIVRRSVLCKVIQQYQNAIDIGWTEMPPVKILPEDIIPIEKAAMVSVQAYGYSDIRTFKPVNGLSYENKHTISETKKNTSTENKRQHSGWGKPKP